MAENAPRRPVPGARVPPPGSAVGLPRELPANAEHFTDWPDGATTLPLDRLIPVIVRLQLRTVDGDVYDREVGALALGWLGDRVVVQVPTLWRVWLAASDVERERFDL